MKKTGGLNFGDYYYARNLHTDVSLLETDAGAVKASYVYKPYGAQDALSDGDLEHPDVLNALRFNDKRLDSGSATLDMGARRYNADIGRFVQQDFLALSSDDLGLASETLTQNRYVFATSNPVAFIETDGHVFAAGDSGGGTHCFPVTGRPTAWHTNNEVDGISVSQRGLRWCDNGRGVVNFRSIRVGRKASGGRVEWEPNWFRPGPNGTAIVRTCVTLTDYFPAYRSDSIYIDVQYWAGGGNNTYGKPWYC